MQQLPQWQLSVDATELTREFRFTDFCQTMAFVNAVAWIAQQQDHHPQMVVCYNRASVHYTTHVVAGLTLNDFNMRRQDRCPANRTPVSLTQPHAFCRTDGQT